MTRGRVLVAGDGEGALLRLQAPISFWGGVDPRTGRISDPRHPDYGVELKDRVVWIESTIGSSSSSSILLELIRGDVAPAALLLGAADPILALGAIVAREMGHGETPLVECDASGLNEWTDGTLLHVDRGGRVRLAQMG